jgi:hypothetical protein
MTPSWPIMSLNQVSAKAGQNPDKTKPTGKDNPSENTVVSEANAAFLKSLGEEEANRASIISEIDRKNEEIGRQQRRQAVAKRMIERLDNFKKEFDVFTASLAMDAAELGISTVDLVSLSVIKLFLRKSRLTRTRKLLLSPSQWMSQALPA